MSDFLQAMEILMNNEGGFKLHKIEGDTGGITYAGITRKNYSNWVGWKYLDNEDNFNPYLLEAVYDFYEEEYWNKIKANLYNNFSIKNLIFNFSVNVGIGRAIKLMQRVLKITQDGIIGPITIETLNKMDSEIFKLKYTIEKISYYTKICNNKSNQKKFLLGWINRSLQCLNNVKE